MNLNQALSKRVDATQVELESSRSADKDELTPSGFPLRRAHSRASWGLLAARAGRAPLSIIPCPPLVLCAFDSGRSVGDRTWYRIIRRAVSDLFGYEPLWTSAKYRVRGRQGSGLWAWLGGL